MKEALKILSAALIGFIIGWYTDKWCTNHFLSNENNSIKEEVETLEKKDSIIREETVIIKDSIITLWREKEIKVDSIKRLPLDSGIEFLKQKLEEYE